MMNSTNIALDNLKKVYQMLEDKKSKDIYLNRLNFLISQDLYYLDKVITTCFPDYVPYNSESFERMIASMPDDRNFVLYGAGEIGEQMLPFVRNDKRFVGFCSQTKKKQEEGYLGYPVMAPEELMAHKDLCVVLSACKQKSEIMQVLKSNDYPKDLIYDGDVAFHIPVFDPGQYFSPDFMKFEDEEVFVDAGCLDFGTSLQLRKYCNNIKKIYAFEPDPENYKRCINRRDEAGFTNAVILPFGTWSERKTLCFSTETFGTSHVCEDQNESGSKLEKESYAREERGQLIQISVMPIDEAIEAGDKVTMIKMDVEGSELESLKGAQNIIRRDKPKLAICIYHKPEDMWEIPLYIKELVPEYKLYIRHHSNDGGETVLYAIMS